MKLKPLLLSLLLVIIPISITYADWRDGVIAYKSGDYITAFNEFLPIAQQGDKEAQAMVATMYSDGRGVKENDKEALKWYLKSANQGMIEVYSQIGDAYYRGLGVHPDHDKAVKWLTKSAEQGVAVGQLRLGSLYNGVQEHKEAVKWLTKAAEQGNAVAQNNLGRNYHRGEGVEQDNKQAFYWFSKSADQDNTTALANLKSMKWLKRYWRNKEVDAPKKEVETPKKDNKVGVLDNKWLQNKIIEYAILGLITMAFFSILFWLYKKLNRVSDNLLIQSDNQENKDLNKDKSTNQMLIERPLLVIAAIMLLVAALDMPSNYYIILRAIVFLVSCFAAFYFLKKQDNFNGFVFILIGILWNPLFPIWLYNKPLWIILDIAAAIYMFTISKKIH